MNGESGTNDLLLSMQKSADMTWFCGFRDGFNHFRVIFRSASAVFVVSDVQLII